MHEVNEFGVLVVAYIIFCCSGFIILFTIVRLYYEIQVWRRIVDKNTERKGITGEKTSRIRISLTKKENNVI